jgi:hypothetical protein
MKFYEVTSDGDTRVVQANSMQEAIMGWAKVMCLEMGPRSGWTLSDEPDSIRLISDGSLIVVPLPEPPAT